MCCRSLVIAALFVSFTLEVSAADWPQWRGPARNGISKETGLAQAWADCNDATFIGKTTIALEVACYGVIAEAASVAHHTDRLAYAQAVVNGDPDSYGRKLARGLVANGISATSSDAAIQNIITNNFNTIAGIGQ